MTWGSAGLRAGPGEAPSDPSSGLLVKSEAASAQLEADRQATQARETQAAGSPTVPAAAPSTPVDQNTPAQERRPTLTRFYGSAQVDTTRFLRDVDKIAQEVLQHLSSADGAEVTITLELEARNRSGFSEMVVRTVTENARTLRFTAAGFEED